MLAAFMLFESMMSARPSLLATAEPFWDLMSRILGLLEVQIVAPSYISSELETILKLISLPTCRYTGELGWTIVATRTRKTSKIAGLLIR